MTTTIMMDIESPATKRIALVAHDNMKDEMLEWAKDHEPELARHTLVGTGTTGRLITEHTGLSVERLRSGRIAAVWNIPVACNRASADFIISSPLISQVYQRRVPEYL
jgi:methylglyoxal synthase